MKKNIGAMLLFFLINVSTSFAAEIKSFSESSWTADQKAGKTTVLQFHADWCPVCAQQKNALGSLKSSSGLEKVVIYSVNFDDSDSLKKKLRVTGQSTLIVFRGVKEAARAQGVTESEEIQKLIQKGI